MTGDSHWVTWHRAYEFDGSPLRLRLEIVQRHLASEISARAAVGGRVRIVSLCAGQGRDVIGALQDHPSVAAVHARLVELDPQLVADARAEVARLGLEGVDVVEGDASSSDCCAGAVPADIV